MESTLNIVINLTEDEAEKLNDVLMTHCDAGPVDEGWKSSVLESVTEKVSEAIDEARHDHQEKRAP